MLRALGVAVLAGLFLTAPSVEAQERSATKTGFQHVPGATPRVLVLRPEIRVGSQSMAGLFEPNQDWTDQARRNLEAALLANEARANVEWITEDRAIGAEPAVLAQYRALFRAVSEAVIEYQFFPGNRLVTKKRDKGLNWTMGPEIGQIARGLDADYALFLYTEDHYGSTGRKVLQLLAAAGGVGVTSGLHIGYAGLVDLRTGDLLWINADQQMGGDVREQDGALKRASQLLEGMPLGSAEAGSRTAASR